MCSDPKCSITNPLVRWTLVAAALVGAMRAQALTITSGPMLVTNTNAPLAAELKLTTDVASRISVSANDGTNSWERNFYDYRTVHSLPLLGFKPARDYTITVTVHDALGNALVAPDALEFKTGPLPSDFIPITVLASNPAKMEPGYTLFRALKGIYSTAYVIMVDSSGAVVWYSGVPSNFGIKRLANGDLFYPLPQVFEEINMLGQTVRTWPLPADLDYNHEATVTERGTFLYLSDASRMVTNFPSSSTDPNAPRKTAKVWYRPVVEMSVLGGRTLNVWSPIDMLDPRRISYFTFVRPNATYGYDWSHANAVIEDPRDDSIIVSIRHQNAVIKFSRTTGKLIWILGPHENWGPEFQQYLLTPVGNPFVWHYGQHAALLTPRGTLLLFDNGNYRASPFDTPVPDAENYSRAVEYAIDQEKMQVSQVWEYGRLTTNRIYAASRGSSKWLPQTGNVLITFADIKYINGQHPSTNSPNAAMEQIVEVTHGLGDPPYAPPEVVFDLSLFDYNNHSPNYQGASGYRAERVPDLYPVNTAHDSVQHLITQVSASGTDTNGTLTLELLDALDALGSGDPPACAGDLAGFQDDLQSLVAPTQPELAGQLNLLAQGIIDAVNNDELSWPGVVAPTLGPLLRSTENGKVTLRFSGDSTRIYAIEASSDLTHWNQVGTASFEGAGQFTFEDDLSGGQPARFYRVVDPLGTIP